MEGRFSPTAHSISSGILLHLSKESHKPGLALEPKIGRISADLGVTPRAIPQRCSHGPGEAQNENSIFVPLGSDWKQPLGLSENPFHSRTCSVQTWRVFSPLLHEAKQTMELQKVDETGFV